MISRTIPAAPGRLPRHHVARPRLVDELAGARAALVVAGGGYGKTLLTAELARTLGVASATAGLAPGDADPAAFVARLRSALTRARLSDLAAAVQAERADPAAAVDALVDALAREPDPVLVVVDDAHHAGAETAGLVRRIAGNLPDGHRLLVLARHLPPHLEPGSDAMAWLGSAQLAFTAGEVAELFAAGFAVELAGGDPEAVRCATGGWAAALVLAGETLARSSEPERELQAIVERRRPLRYLVDRRLAALDDRSRAAVVQLAHLPLLSAALAEQVSGDARLLERVGDAGMPIGLRADGWWELPGPVQELLARRAPLEPATALAAAPEYARQGELSSALQVLLATAEGDAAAALVAGISPQEADELGYLELQTLIDALPADAVERSPGVLLHLARACEPATQVQLRTDVLERARPLAERAADAPLTRALEAEVARDLVRHGQPEQAETLAERLLAEAGPGEIATRARLLDVLGWAAAWRRGDASLSRAERLLREALTLCERMGQRSWASQAALPLAYYVHYARGRHEQALEVLDRVLAPLPDRSPHRGIILSFLADILIDAGRFDEAGAVVEEERALGALLADNRIAAYAAWSGARLASQLGDAGRTVREIREAEVHRDEWFEHWPGVDFMADAANLLDRTGEHELASEYLERARERGAECPLELALAELAVLARSGDPEAAERAYAEVDRMQRLQPRDRWWIALLRAYAALRRGDERAGGLAAEAFERAAALGKPFLPLVRERVVAERLVGLAAASGSGAAAALQQSERPLTLTVLGRFEVRRAGELVRLPPGKPEQLVKLLAVSGGRLVAEQAIEELWPEVDPRSGRKRLRNVLNRLHAVAPDIALRSGEALALGEAEVDAELFERQARRVLDDPQPGACRLALALYRGPLLPDERYESWTAAPRERLERLFVALLDAAAEAAEVAGQVDEALRHLERALSVDPYDEERYLCGARLLLDQGRRAAALTLLSRGADALARLGVPVPAEHEELAAAARS